MNDRLLGWLVGSLLLIAQPAVSPARAAMPKVPDGFKIRLVAAVPAVQYSLPGGHGARRLVVRRRRPDGPGRAGEQADRPHPPVPRRQGAGRLRRQAERDLRHGLARRGPLRDEHAAPDRLPRPRRRRQGRRAQGAVHGPGRPRRLAQRLQRPHRLRAEDRHRRVSLYLGRRQGRARRPPVPTAGPRRWSAAACCAAGSTATASRSSRPAHATTSSPISTTATTSSPTTTPTTAWAGGRGSRITSTAAITAIRSTITTGTDRMLPRIAEYGGGSPCGGVFYGEDVWPEKYRGRLFWAEWGKRVVQCLPVRARRLDVQGGRQDRLRRAGRRRRASARSTWCCRHDGETLYVADWSMGGWNNKTEKLGRVYAVTYNGDRCGQDRASAARTPTRSTPSSAAARPSRVQRASRAQTALIRGARTRSSRSRPRWRSPRPTRSPGGTWSGCSTRSPAARPRPAIP